MNILLCLINKQLLYQDFQQGFDPEIATNSTLFYYEFKFSAVFSSETHWMGIQPNQKTKHLQIEELSALNDNRRPDKHPPKISQQRGSWRLPKRLGDVEIRNKSPVSTTNLASERVTNRVCHRIPTVTSAVVYPIRNSCVCTDYSWFS